MSYRCKLFLYSLQAAAGWLPWRNCQKINHSSGTLSFLVPSFLSSTFSGEGEDNKVLVTLYTVCTQQVTYNNWSVSDAIAQLAVDNTRNTLYARSEKGTIQVCFYTFI